MITGTISIVEIIWTVAAIPSLILWTRYLLNTIGSLRVARASADPARRLIGAVMFRLAVAGVFASALLIAMGIFAMTQPQVTSRVTLLGWAVTVVVVCIAAVITMVGMDINRATVMVWHYTDDVE